jgi:hypothetical protein
MHTYNVRKGHELRLTALQSNKPADRHVITKVAAKYGTLTCPVCELEVPARKNGDVGSHSVGSSSKNSWPCPGSAAVS